MRSPSLTYRYKIRALSSHSDFEQKTRKPAGKQIIWLQKSEGICGDNKITIADSVFFYSETQMCVCVFCRPKPQCPNPHLTPQTHTSVCLRQMRIPGLLSGPHARFVPVR
jgi:hypothetical protein